MEKPPSGEFSESERVLIDALRNKGKEDPEVQKLLQAWIAEGEVQEKGVRGHLEWEMRCAKLWLEAGFKEAAIETLEDLRYMASQEGDEEILNQAEKLLDEIYR